MIVRDPEGKSVHLTFPYTGNLLGTGLFGRRNTAEQRLASAYTENGSISRKSFSHSLDSKRTFGGLRVKKSGCREKMCFSYK